MGEGRSGVLRASVAPIAAASGRLLVSPTATRLARSVAQSLPFEKSPSKASCWDRGREGRKLPVQSICTIEAANCPKGHAADHPCSRLDCERPRSSSIGGSAETRARSRHCRQPCCAEPAPRTWPVGWWKLLLLRTTVRHAQASMTGDVLIGPGVRGAMKRDSVVATKVIAAGFAITGGSVGLGYVASWKRHYRSLLRHGRTRNCQGENHRAHANREKHRSLLSPRTEARPAPLVFY